LAKGYKEGDLMIDYIGIIGAMEIEINQLKEKMDIEEAVTVASMKFYKGYYRDKSVVIVRSGIGKVNAAICTQILIERFKVKVVINTGIAGSLDKEIDIGDIVISKDALQHDMDATNFGYDYGIIPQMDKSIFDADEHLIRLAESVCQEVNSDIRVFIGRVVSGDQFISEKHAKDIIRSRFRGLCTEMEGAAIAQAAYLSNTPFVIIRAISDKADESARISYSEFEEKAADHSFRLVDGMLKQI